MIVDKNPQGGAGQVPEPPQIQENDPIEVEENPIEQVYLALRRVLGKLADPDNPSKQLFHTVKLDSGQFEKIVHDKHNKEFAIAFPAVFIRFVNVRFLVSQQRIGEGRATVRIRYVLNDLNNSDDVVETRGMRVFQAINDAIQAAKSYEPAINERCNLTFWDMVETMGEGLQPYWIDYEIWFRNSSSWYYKDWVDRYLVMPPFTNHSDAPEHDEEHHGDHLTPTEEDSVTIV